MTRLDPEQVKAATDIVQLVSRYTQLRKMGSEYVGLCFLHNDTTAPGNLYVNPAKQVWACFACVAHEKYGADAIGFLRSAENIDFPEAVRRLANGSGTLPPTKAIPAEALKKAPPRENLPAPDGDLPDMRLAAYGDPTGTWAYRTAEGGIIGYVCRYHDEERGKTLRCFSYGRYSEVDPPKWECKAFSSPRPLYGLELLAGRPEAQVLLVEGEKSADAARQLIPAMVVMAWPGGANAAKYADWSPLAGRNVVLWPDADAPGRQAMERVAALLQGVAAEVKGVDPDTQPDGSATPEGWDAADALAAGWDREKTLDWAKQRITVYVAPQQPDAETGQISAPQNLALSPPPPNAPESPVANAEPGPSPSIPDAAESLEAPFPPAGEASATMPDAEFPPEATPVRPRRPRKPALASVNGNTVRVLEIEPEADLPPEFSEQWMVRLFIENRGNNWRYSHDSKTWHRWVEMGDGGVWQLQKTSAHTIDIDDFLNSEQLRSAALTMNQRQRICSMKMTNSLVPGIQNRPPVASLVENWDTDPWLLGLPDGRCVELKTGTIRPATREDMIGRYTLVAPQRGPHPHWDMVLSRAAAGDGAMLEYLRLWAGCCVTGDTSPEAFTYLYGKGGAGKSKYILPLLEILNDYARQIQVELFLAGQSQNRGEQLAQLPGIRLAVASEPDEGTRWAEGQLKAATGRNRISCRDVYARRIEYMPQFKLIFEGNNKPHLRGVGEEIRRRFKLVEFKAGSIPTDELMIDMPDRLRREYPAILQWLIDAAADYSRTGLSSPEQMEIDVSEYLRSEDQIATWLDDCCEIDQAQRVRVLDAYENYRKFCERDGEYVVAKKTFSSRLHDRGFKLHKSGDRFIIGIGLRIGANI